MITRTTKLVAIATSVSFAAIIGQASADEIAPGEIIVPEEEPAPPPAAEPPPPEPEGPCCVVPPLGHFDDITDHLVKFWGDHGITIGSGLSTSYQWSIADPPSNKVGGRSLITTHNRYFVDLFQLTLAKNDQPAQGQFGGLVQFDVGRLTRNLKTDWNGSGFNKDTEWERNELEFQQAYLQYNVPIGNGIMLTGGKFNTLIGEEVIEPWNNFNYSRSYIFGFGGPFTHTGGYASYQATDMVKISLGGVLGWDNFEDQNDNPSAIGRIDLTPNDMIRLSLSGIIGPEQSCDAPNAIRPNGSRCNRNMRGVFDIGLAVQPLEHGGMVMEYLYGSEDEASATNPGRHATWQGISTTLWYDIIPDCVTTAVRGEWFQDDQGARIGFTQNGRPSRATVWEIAADVRAQLSETVYVRAEYRHDEADRQLFEGGANRFQSGQDTVALELGYQF